MLTDEEGIEAQGHAEAVVPVEERLAPILRLSGGELFRPVSRREYVSKTELIAVYDRKRHADWRVPLDRTPMIDELPRKPVACDQRFRTCHFALEVDDAGPAKGAPPYVAIQDLILGRSRLTVYWHREADDHTIQYWFLYVFNDWSNRHESDWEQITVQLDKQDRPVRLGYSSHGGGQSMSWPDAAREGVVEDGHPVVLVARGSHANYFLTGTRFPEECLKRVHVRRLCTEVTDALGPTIRPADYDLRQLEPPVFHGDYGSGNFAGRRGTWRRISTGIVVGDPQSREVEWSNPTKWFKNTHPADGKRREQPIGES